MTFAAVISDLDGVLVDSAGATTRAWAAWGARHGFDGVAIQAANHAPSGIAAGRAAGMTVWAVTTTHAAADLSAAHRVAPDLPELLAGLPRRTTGVDGE